MTPAPPDRSAPPRPVRAEPRNTARTNRKGSTMGTRGKPNDSQPSGPPNDADGQSTTVGGGNTGTRRKPKDDK